MQSQHDRAASTNILLSSLEQMLKLKNYDTVYDLIKSSPEHFQIHDYDELVGPAIVEHKSDFKEIFKSPLGIFLLNNASNTLSLAIKAQPTDIKYLVETFASKASKNQLGNLVIQLINDNQIELAKWILKNISNINLKWQITEAGNEALHLALLKDVLDMELVELLCKHGADLNKKNKESMLPLDIALRKSQYPAIALFVRDHADKLTSSQCGEIVLTMTSVGQKQIVKSLLSKRKFHHVGCYKATGNHALHCEASSAAPDLDLLISLIQSGLGLSSKNKAGETPFLMLLKNNHYSIINALINKFPIYKAHAKELIQQYGYSFHKALEVENPNLDFIAMLSNAHVDVMQTNAANQSVLDVVRIKNQLPLLKYFVVRHVNQFELNQLLEVIPILVNTNNIDAIKYISEKRPQIVKNTQYQNSLIAKAFYLILHDSKISADLVRSLCQAGMILSIENREMKSILRVAIDHRNFAAVKALLEVDVANRVKSLNALKVDEKKTALQIQIEMERTANVFKVRQIEEIIPLLINHNQQGLLKLILLNYTDITDKYFSDVILVQALTRAVLLVQPDLEYIELLCNAARVNPLYHVPGVASPLQLALDHKPNPLFSVLEKFLVLANDKMDLDNIIKIVDCLVKNKIENLVYLKYLQSKSNDYHVLKVAAYKIVFEKLHATDNIKDILQIVKVMSDMKKSEIGFLKKSHAFISTIRAKKWDNHSVSSEWVDLMEFAKQRILSLAKDTIFNKEAYDFLSKPTVKNSDDSLLDAIKYRLVTREIPNNMFWNKNTLPTDRTPVDEKDVKLKARLK